MSSKLSARLGRKGRATRAGVSALRWFGRTGLGRRAGPLWYRRRALAMARDLARLDGVDAVYLSGSSLDTALLGYSDIDLMVVTTLPDLGTELALRSAFLELVRRHNRPIELFLHLDYLEARDLELLRYLGNAFALELDSRWAPLAGVDHRRSPPVVDSRHRTLAQLLDSVSHWLSQSVELTRPHRTPDRPLQLRVARRLFAGILGAWLEAPRLPLADALELTRGRAPGEITARLAKDAGRAAHAQDAELIAELLVASLEVLDAHVAAECSGFTEAWPAISAAPAPIAWDGAERWAKVALSSGFAGFEVAARGPAGAPHLALCTAGPSTSPRTAVAQLRALIARAPALPETWFGRSTVPVLLTPALRRAAALIAPFPLLAAGLSASPAFRRPQGLDPPLAPARRDLEILTTIALVQSFWRPRGRTLRFGRQGQRALSAMTTEVFHQAPLLLALLRGAPLEFWGPRAGADSADRVLERLRQLHGEIRTALAPRLAIARKTAGI